MALSKQSEVFQSPSWKNEKKTRAWNGQNASLSHMYLDPLSKAITASTISLVYF